ncbi:MAG TPA: hypothetical protein VGK20_16790 [Candidatus Binatia bacterium]|jgi:hypothetical protein
MIKPSRFVLAAVSLASLLSTSALAENRTTIQIATVLASNSGRTFDSRLASLRGELKQLRFKSYTLVRSDTRVLHGNGGQCGMDLPNGRYLHITTREHTPDHLRLHILLNEDNHPVVNTYVKLELGSVVLLGGPRDDNGTLVITIGSRPWRTEDAAFDDAKSSGDSNAADDPEDAEGASASDSHCPTPAVQAAMPSAAPAAVAPTGQH